ncbi:MAG: flagellar hook basal-body protein [Candidatus Saganbacteria bacterium]|nr:flagellar hook basal-body protein [Candidatus Saganbacteria bacterium]
MMLDIMSQASNAIQAYNSALSLTSANIANMSVTGYKKMGVSFQTVFERFLHRGTASADFNNLGGTNPYQIGGSMAIAETYTDFAQGDIASGGHLDLAVNGQGLFVVSADGGSTFQYTRAGNFDVDSSGNLITSTGYPVYGFYGSSSILMPITGLTSDKYTINNLSFDNNGYLYEYTDNTYSTVKADTGFRIALTRFNNPNGLEQASGSNFKETAASGSPSEASLPGQNSTGNVSARNLEASNVFYLGETIKALEYQRAMSGNLSMVRMASDIISNFINRLS